MALPESLPFALLKGRLALLFRMISIGKLKS
jgi:hypothetical protein